MTDGTPPSGAAPDSRPGQAGLHRRLVAGWASKMLSLAIAIGEQILLVPVFLIFWGPALYGDWLVLLSSAAFLMLLDGGLQSYYANAFHLALSRGDRAAFSRLFRHAAAIYATLLAVALPVVLTVCALVPWTGSLNLASTGEGTATRVLLFLMLYFLAGLPFGAANAIYRAHGHFAVGVIVANIVQIALITTTGVVLWAGGGPVGLGIAYLVIVAAGWALIVAHQKRRYPALRYGIEWPDGAAWRELIGVAPLYALVPAAMLLTTRGVVILIAALAAGGQAVAAYVTLRTLTGIARLITDQATQVAGVEIARQYAEKDDRALTTLYDFMTRLAGGLCGATGGAIAFFGPPFLAIWTVGKIPFDPQIFWPLLAAAALSGPAIAAASVLQCINRPGGMAAVYGVAGVVTVVLSLILIPMSGASGAAWAVLAGEAGVLAALMPLQTARVIGGSAVARIVVTQLYAGAAFSIGGGGAWFALWYAGSEDLPELALAGLVWTVIVLPPLYFLLFSRDRRQWMGDRLRERLGR